jgi:signal transduction histidine kinase/CheY-like chemotaxis protein
VARAFGSKINRIVSLVTRGLRRRIALYTAGTTFLVVALLSVINSQTQTQLVNARVLEKSMSMGALLRELSLPYLIDGRPADMAGFYQALEKQPDIVSVFMVDPDLDLLASGSSHDDTRGLSPDEDALIKRAADSGTRQTHWQGNIIDVAIPVTVDDHQFGVIRYSVLTDPGEGGISLVFQRNLAFGILFTAASIFTSLYIARHLSAPLERLNRATQEAAAGDLAQFVDIRTNDEVESLSRSFNIMLGNLRSRLTAHEQAQRRLEEIGRDLNDKNAQLARALDQARTAEAAKSEFLASMSHEIRTPMNGVLGMTELLSETQMDDHQANLVETIGSSGQALLRIINDILDFSKIEAGHMTLLRDPFAICDLVEDTARVLSIQAAVKNVDVIARCDPALPEQVQGDFARMKQVLLNFASNAVKFTESGHVLIHAERAQDATGADFLKISVSDTGCGIPEDKLEHVFNRFTQVDGSYSREHQGTGLGLAISKGFVELMGGHIKVTSALGKGSCFAFFVPLAPLDGRITLPDGAQAQSALVVSASAPFSTALCERLRGFGLGVREIQSGAAAMKCLKEDPDIDVIFVDVDVADMTGLELIDRIHAEQPASKRLILFEKFWEAPQGTPAWHEGKPLLKLRKPLLTRRLVQALAPGTAPDWHAGTRPTTGAGCASATQDDKGKPPARPILIVDDNKTNLKVIELVLAKMNLPYVAATNGAEALEQFQITRPSLVLMDISMPVMNGLDATRAIREFESGSPDGGRSHIIGLTAHSSPRDQEACIAAGMDQHMSKPVNLRKLRSLLEENRDTAA